MTFQKGAPAPNRKILADDIIQADIAAGMSNREIALKHGVSRTAIHNHVNRKGWRAAEIAEKKAAKAEDIAAAERRYPTDTQAKVVRKRDCYVFFGKDLVRETQFISLPRLPSIHGHFQGA